MAMRMTTVMDAQPTVHPSRSGYSSVIIFSGLSMWPVVESNHLLSSSFRMCGLTSVSDVRPGAARGPRGWRRLEVTMQNDWNYNLHSCFGEKALAIIRFSLLKHDEIILLDDSMRLGLAPNDAPFRVGIVWLNFIISALMRGWLPRPAEERFFSFFSQWLPTVYFRFDSFSR